MPYFRYWERPKTCNFLKKLCVRMYIKKYIRTFFLIAICIALSCILIKQKITKKKLLKL